MAETTINDTFFWNGSRYYGQDELEIMTDSFMCSGVRIRYDGTMDLKPYLSFNNIMVYLSPGDALSGGHWFHLATDKAYTPTSDQRGKKCALFIRTDWGNKETAPVIVAGTSSTYPSPTRDWGNIFDIEICTFNVDSNGTCSNLKDMRTNGSVCGGIRARGNSELDEYLKQATDQFENWFDTVLSTSGWVQVYAQSTQPAKAAIGSVWVDNSSWHIKKKEKANFWQTVCGIMPYHIYGVRMENELVKSKTINPVPFTKPREGFVADSKQCNYARYVGVGKSAISKKGIYTINVMIRISDEAQTQKFHAYLYKQDAKNNVKIGEAYCDNTSFKKDSRTKDVMLNISATVYCAKDEVLTVRVVPSGKYSYRIATQSNITIYPVKIE